MFKPVSKSQYHIGNDKAIPDSAFVADSYLDGIYTKFDPENAPSGWLSVQDTFKLDLPQSTWQLSEEQSYASGMVTSAIFTSGYDHATTGPVLEQFPDIVEDGRGEYVEKE